MLICPNCNNTNYDGVQHCAYCGFAHMTQPMQLPYGSSPQSTYPQQPYPQYPYQQTEENYAQLVTAQYGQQPGNGYAQPTVNYAQPVTNYAQPAVQHPYAQHADQQSYIQHSAQHSHAQSPTDYTQASTTSSAPAHKSKIVAGLLALFLGNLGVHRFYLGNTKAGIINLVLFILILPIPILMLISLIEGIKYLTMSQEKFNQEYVYGHRAWF